MQTLPSSQTTFLPDWQLLSLQTSLWVQTLPSSQGWVLAWWTQPVLASQASSVQTFWSSQLTASPGTQLLSLQASPWVQALLSVQVTVFARKTQQLALSQLSSVHKLPSVQVKALPGTHAELLHKSPLVQASPSSQGWTLAMWTQPLLASQASSLHKFLSSQLIALPGWQAPSWQTSESVHAFLSLQGAVLFAKTHPKTLSQLSSVHKFPSLQVIAEPGTHALFAHVSPLVQASPSSQVSKLARLTQPSLASQESSVHGLASSHAMALPGRQLPSWQTSPLVHALLSVQGNVLLVKTQPPFWSQLSLVQPLPSSHCRPLPDWHLLLAQMSPEVQALPSSQATLLALWVQPPAAGLHASLVQTSLSSQSKGLPGTQLPAAQVSPCEQGLPSSQTAVLLTWLQADFASQLSVVHGFPSSQLRGLAVTHRPPRHWSPRVQASLSVHGLVLTVLLQPSLGSQESVVQPLASLQSVAAPGRQAPPWHASPPVQALLSEHGAVLFVITQPLAASQLSSVHGLPSLQAMAWPGTHLPLLQVSPLVHTSPSLQGVVLSDLLQPPAASQISVVHGLPSSQGLALTGLHTPKVQVSPVVHWLKSSQGTVFGRNWQPKAPSQESSVHGLPSLQVSAEAWLHRPLLQKSPKVQALLSLHGRTLAALAQPVLGSQLSVVHGLSSLQLVISPGKHAPAEQASPLVQALLSVQTAVSSLVKVQPMARSQPSEVHGFPSSQTGAAPATQVPSLQVSPTVQALPSSHLAVVAPKTQPLIASQLSAVQGFWSSHAVGAPGKHAPSLQVSPSVQTLPSSQAPVLLVLEQPAVLSQVSVVHRFLSSQAVATPPWHEPSLQPSPVVHLSPSSQPAVPLLWLQLPSLQLSIVQAFLSSQSVPLPPTQTPAAHKSAWVQALPSSQGVPSPARPTPQTPPVQVATLQASVTTGHCWAVLQLASALPSPVVVSTRPSERPISVDDSESGMLLDEAGTLSPQPTATRTVAARAKSRLAKSLAFKRD